MNLNYGEVASAFISGEMNENARIKVNNGLKLTIMGYFSFFLSIFVEFMVKVVYYKACHRFVCDRSIELQKLVSEWIKHHLNSHAS
ncbi:hypothetical protein SAMN05421839_11347 [Halolactibacillus halophilus]|uniref:Uncharacterized protein n=1 Tax=Halolactibacillus halophilus TaxID=306540 RepID=A0A1I5PAE2_9BACI|nr:hypothetical protein HHA03_11920 [Halolactibacillus halophilus]SFP30491.1 hypothetical protein SAMN05421839_11347 [Halolactibacillus halophilus]